MQIGAGIQARDQIKTTKEGYNSHRRDEPNVEG
jgi:hypothetical protein